MSISSASKLVGERRMVGKYRILIIDDDDSIRETLGITLEEEGYVVDTAKDGKEAIAKSNVNFYNLAIVDWRLPDIEGAKLLGNLRETTPKMAKIMLTGYPSMQNAIDSVNAQADAFFVKPAGIEPLLEKIKELLKKQEQARKYSEEKMVEYIETRAKELRPAEGITA
jgi:DNA-binding response OmpR family regulator